MKARLVNFSVLASLALAIALISFWIRGMHAMDRVAFGFAGRYFSISTFPHHIYCFTIPGWPGMSANVELGLQQYPAAAKYWEPRFTGGALALPFWLPLLFALVLPAWWLIGITRRLRRHKPGLCPLCGYDLRASKDYCPECGSTISPGDAART